MSADPVVIASQPSHVFHALLSPADLTAWWGCTVVTDARPGGVWVGGWGEGTNGLGQGTVLSATLSRLETDRLVALEMGGTEIAFHIEAAPQGTTVRLEQPGADPATEKANLASWLDALSSLKAWVEQAHPYTPPAQPTASTPSPSPSPSASPTPTQGADPAAGVQGAAGSDPYAVAGASAVKVIDEGGFGVTDPHAVVKSWSKEQGFGYATHPQLGDVVFDYDGCDFEPAPGDKVLLLVIGKRYDGKPKVKRIACPAKGSNIR